MARKRRKQGGSTSGGARPSTPPPPAARPQESSSRAAASDSAEPAGAHTSTHTPDATRDGPRPDWWGLHLWQIQPIRDVLLIAAVVLVVQIGYALRIVTIPILVAMLIAYLIEPLIERLTRRKWISRQGAALMVIVTAAIIVVAPLTLGIGFAAVQATQLARSLATNIGLIRTAASNADDPVELERTMERLPNDGWRSIAEYWIELQEQADARLTTPDGAPLPTTTGSDPQAARTPATGGATGASGAADSSNASTTGDDRTSSPTDRPRSIAPLDDEDFSVWPIRWATLDAVETGSGQTAEPEEHEAGPDLRAERLRDARSAEFELLRLVTSWIEAHTNEIVQQSLATGRGAVGLALGTAGGLGVFLFQGFLTAFFFYFFSTGWGKVQDFWQSLIPERRKGFVIDLLRKMDAVIAGFVRGRLLIGVILSIYFTIMYWLIGVPAPLLLGPITGALCLVPYLGIVSVPTAIITMWLAPSPWFTFQTTWWWMVFAPIVGYNLGQFLDDYILTPNIQGKSTDMDVPSILFATIAGGAIGGIYGLLLAIPVAACIKILMRELFWPRFQRWATGKERDFLPIDRH